MTLILEVHYTKLTSRYGLRKEDDGLQILF